MSIQRTPPRSQSAQVLSQSDSDIPRAMEEEVVNITTRSKRPRTESSSPRNEFVTFQNEMRHMFESLKSGQLALLNKLVEDVNEIKLQSLKIQKSNTEIEKSLETIKNNYEDMKAKLGKLEKERLECYNYIQKLQNRIEDLEFGSRSSCIELRNIPSKENETAEDIVKHVINVGKTLSLDINYSHIRDAYRLPAKPGRNKTIVVDFSTVLIKNKILISTRDFNKNKAPGLKLNSSLIGIKGQPLPIYVSEYLPGNGRKLFYRAREFANSNHYKFCWTSNQRIFLRKDEASKRIQIRSEEDFVPLKSI